MPLTRHLGMAHVRTSCPREAPGSLGCCTRPMTLAWLTCSLATTACSRTSSTSGRTSDRLLMPRRTLSGSRSLLEHRRLARCLDSTAVPGANLPNLPRPVWVVPSSLIARPAAEGIVRPAEEPPCASTQPSPTPMWPPSPGRRTSTSGLVRDAEGALTITMQRTERRPGRAGRLAADPRRNVLPRAAHVLAGAGGAGRHLGRAAGDTPRLTPLRIAGSGL